jgi:hypothetical protein
MGELITSDKIKEMLTSAPPEVDKGRMVQTLVDKGYDIEGLNYHYKPFVNPIKMAGKVPESAWNVVSALGNVLIHPLATAKSLSNAVLGALSEAGITKDDPDKEAQFDRVVQFYKDRFGSATRLRHTIENDPVGFAMDAAGLLSGAGAVVKGAGAVGKIAGAAGIAEKASAIGGGLLRTSSLIDPGQQLVNAARNFNKVAGVTEAIGNTTTLLGAGLGKAALTDFKMLFRERAGNFMNELGIHGPLPDIQNQLGQVVRRTKGIVDDQLATVTKRFNLKSSELAVKELKDLFGDKDFGREMSKQAAVLDDFSNKIASKQGLTLTEANSLKRMIDEYETLYKKRAENSGATVKDDFNSKVIAGVRDDLNKDIASRYSLSNKIVNGLQAKTENILKLNEQTRKAEMLRQVVEKIDAGTSPRLNALYHVVPYVVGGAAGFMGAHVPGMIAGTLGAGMLTNPRFMTWLGNKIQLLSIDDFKALEGYTKMQNAQQTTPIGRGVDRMIGAAEKRVGVSSQGKIRGITGNQTDRAMAVLRKIRRDAMIAFPAAEVAGRNAEISKDYPLPTKPTAPLEQTAPSDVLGTLGNQSGQMSPWDRMKSNQSVRQ